MPEGLIVKALSGYYYVKPALAAAEGNVQCRGRGIFKKRELLRSSGTALFIPRRKTEKARWTKFCRVRPS